MLENEMEESQSGTTIINDVSYEALRAFVNYLYTAEASLTKHIASSLIVLAEKYEVNGGFTTLWRGKQSNLETSINVESLLLCYSK